MAFNASISGINAAQQEMSVISNNIVNAGTIGFKKGEAEFAELFSSSMQSAEPGAGQGVELTGIRSDFSQGEFQFTSSVLDLAIDGGGLFVLREGDSNLYSRAGAFRVDTQGYIVNSSGLNLQGYQPDQNGALTQAIGDLRISTDLMDQRQTSSVSFAGNVDSRAEASAVDFSIDDPLSYVSSSTTTIYDSAGEAHQLAIYFAKDAENLDTFNVYVAIDDVLRPEVGALTFDNAGVLSEDSVATIDIAGFAPDGADVMDFSIDLSDTSSFGTDSGAVAFTQDGYPAGELLSFEFDDSGTLYSTYTNGEIRAQGQLILASFINPSQLRPSGNTNYAQSEGSGAPTLGAPSSGARGFIRPSALETANVDITQELLALIEAQRNFQSNAQAIQNEDEATRSIQQL